MIQTLLFAIVVLLLLTLGVILVFGTLKGWEPLVHPPDSWMVFYPYGLIRKLFGEGAIAYLHIFIGVVFILATIWLVIYVSRYL